MNLQRIALSRLVSSNQPRPLLTDQVDFLAASIKELGLIQPITVTNSVDVSVIAEPGWQIVAGHHRVAACRALGWTEIDAIVIDKQEHLQTELIEIDENLCRAELTAAQRTAFSKRRKQIWEALHPEIQVAQREPPVIGYASPPPQTMGFAAATAAATGQSKATTNRAIARADALGDDALAKVVNTSLDSGVELDALARLNAPERSELIERAVAGEHVSARTQNAPMKPSSAPARALPMRLYKAVHDMVHGLGFSNYESLIDAIGDLPELSEAEDATLNDALEIFRRIGALEVV
jgi:hypothetical protein